MKNVKLATLLVAVAWSAGCRQAPATSGAPTSSASEVEVVSIPFECVVDPAVVKDVRDKRVEFDAQFGGVIDSKSDLPAQYRDGYVRFSLLGGPGSTSVTRDAVIASERSELVTTLAPLTGVRVRAVSVPEVKVVGLRQTREPDVLLVVDSVVPR